MEERGLLRITARLALYYNSFVIVETIFIAKSGQTPGMKAYNIKVIELSTDRVPNSVVLIIFRQLLGLWIFYCSVGF